MIKGMSLRGDYDMPAGSGNEVFLGVTNILEGILPMDQIDKPVLGFIVPSLLKVIRLMTEHIIFLCL